MISLKLWRALSKPPRRHPLFKYVLAKAKEDNPQVTSGFFVWAMMLMGFLFFFVVIVEWFLPIILIALVALNSIYAMRWSVRIATAIIEEKEANRYDLLAALPIGLLGTNWAISTGCIHQRSSFKWLPYIILILNIVAFLVICSLVTLTLTLLEPLSNTEAAFVGNLYFARVGIVALPFTILFYIDHIYSILTAVLVGQVATLDNGNLAEGQIRALLGFLAVQLTLYVFTFGIAGVALPALFASFGQDGIDSLVLIGILGVGLFIVMREIIVYQLWKFLARFLEADAKEIALVLKPFYEAEAILKESEKARAKYMDATP